MPRGRSRLYDSQRDLILAQAARLFAQQGYPGTSMNQVAQACGVSKPTLYHYVRDKYQLLVEITEAHIQRLCSLVDEVVAQNLAPQARMRELIHRFVIEYASAKHQHRVLTEDVKFLSDADRDRIYDGERQVVAAFATAIAQARPDLDPAQLSKPLAMLLFGMINWMFTWLRANAALTHEDMAPVVADLFFGGLDAVRLPDKLLTVSLSPKARAGDVHSRAKPPPRRAAPHDH